MTAILGIVSLLQIAVLPGAAIVYALRLGRLAPTVPTVFGLSLLFNQLFVIAAVVAGVYVRTTVVLLVCCELALLAGLLAVRRDWNTRRTSASAVGSIAAAWQYWRRPNASMTRTMVEMLAVGWASHAIISSIAGALQNSADGFDTWDAVQSWNRWAVDWADGRIAQHTWHYPQLIPTNWSISYVLLNDHALTIFPSSLDRFFLPALLFVLFWYAVKRQEYLLAAAVPVCAEVFSSVLGPFVGGAGSDVPVAFFAILSAVVILGDGSPNEDRRTQTRRLVLAGTLTVACVTTKQAGWIWFVAFALVTVAQAREGKLRLRPKSITAILVLTLVAGSLWYVYVENRIAAGELTSEIAYVTGDVHSGRNILARTVHALNLLEPWVWLICIASVFAAADRSYRLLVVSMVLPSLATWMILFSYDRRNLAIGIPFISLTAVVGLRLLATSLPTRSPRLLICTTSAAAIGLASVAAMALALVANRYDYDRLLTRQYYKEALSFGPPPDGGYLTRLNELLTATAKPARVISLERYACVLSISRARGCEQVQNENELKAALLQLPASVEVFIIAPLTPHEWLERAAKSLRIEKRHESGGHSVWVRVGDNL